MAGLAIAGLLLLGAAFIVLHRDGSGA
jgi:hypothetical protein